MTILVVFGNKGIGADKLDFAHGAYVSGDNEDRIYFAEDREYNDDDAPLSLPEVTVDTILSVIQHNSSGHHNAQLKWLERVTNYSPVNVGYFSHGHRMELFETIKKLLNQPTNKEKSHQDRVSGFVEQYGKRAVLKCMDNCAAWNALFAISKDSWHEKKMLEYAGMVQPYISDNLNMLDENYWLPALEKAAARFC